MLDFDCSLFVVLNFVLAFFRLALVTGRAQGPSTGIRARLIKTGYKSVTYFHCTCDASTSSVMLKKGEF